jgi:hypothetical protein
MYKPILTTVLFAVLASSQLTAQEKTKPKNVKKRNKKISSSKRKVIRMRK